MPEYKYRDLIKMIKSNWMLIRTSGSHERWMRIASKRK